MASSTKTENYQLNQYSANDQPTWVGDYSGDMLKIDTALGNSTKRTGDKFSEAKTYAVGNLCIKDDLLYKFTAAKEAGAWDETKVKATTIEAEFEQLNGDITILAEKALKVRVTKSLTTEKWQDSNTVKSIDTGIDFTTGDIPVVCSRNSANSSNLTFTPCLKDNRWYISSNCSIPGGGGPDSILFIVLNF